MNRSPRIKRLSAGLLLAASLCIGWWDAHAADQPLVSAGAANTYRAAPGEPRIGTDTLVRGRPDARYTLFEYSDFQCPFCGPKTPGGGPGAYKTVESLRRKYGEDLRIVFKNNPLSFHAQAMPAAQWIQAAALQSMEKAWALHDKFFENQDKLGEPFYEETAQGLGLDVKRLRDDIQGRAVKDSIEADMREAKEFGLGGTPSFIVHGVAFAGALPQKVFEDAITGGPSVMGGTQAAAAPQVPPEPAKVYKPDPGWDSQLAP